MMIHVKLGRWGRRLFLAAVAAVLVSGLLAGPAAADDKYWNNGTDYWDVAAAWNPVGQPQAGDPVYLTQSGATDLTVWYRNTTNPTAVLYSLYVNATGAGMMTLDQGYGGYGHELHFQEEYIGGSATTTGKGAFNQSAGLNAIRFQLYLGYKTTSTGYYNLSGTGSLSADGLYIGYLGSGTGAFTQSGGSNTISSFLYLGYSSATSGTYNLSGGSLSAAGQYVGLTGNATFTQTGGSNTVNAGGKLYVGNNSASGKSGTYNLQGGSLSAPEEQVGLSGTGNFTHSAGTNTVSGDLKLGINSSGFGNYTLSGTGSLSAANQYVGDVGDGAFTQTGGSNTVNAGGKLYVGNNSDTGMGKSGFYNLQGGSLSAPEEQIGVSSTGRGTFTQSGGTNTVTNTLTLAVNPGSQGAYHLQGGSLTAGTVNLNSGGVFNQTGGSLNATTFNQQGGTVLGNLENRGAYNYNSGTFSGRLLNYGTAGFNADFIAGNGLAHFSPTPLTIASGRTVTLNGQGLDNQGTLTVNGTLNGAGPLVNAEAGTISQNSGSTMGGTLTNRGTFTYNGGTFGGRLVNYATANLFAGGNTNFTAADGLANYTDMTLTSPRTLTLNGQGLDNSGSLTLAGGTLNGNGSLVNNVSLSGYGTIGGSGGFTNNAFFSQSGGNLTLNNTGANANYGNFDLAASKLFTLGSGATLANQGSLNLNGATIGGLGALDNAAGGTISGNGAITANFTNSAGLVLVGQGSTNISKAFTNSGIIQLSQAASVLSGGAISNSGTIQGIGNVGNNLTNTGIVEVQGGTLTLGGAVSNAGGGLMTAATGNKLLITQGMSTNSGSINLTGGTFDNNNRAMTVGSTGQVSGYGIIRTGGLSNNGIMTLTGGLTTVNGPVTNQASGNINVAYNPAIFAGNVANYGTVKNTQTTITWAGTFTNSGAYLSDPGTQYFTDLIISPTGYLQGGVEDKWSLSGNFQNQSTQNTLWNTRLSDLAFTGGSGHQLYIPGVDLGQSVAGYSNNFAWGSLDLSGQSLTLYDGNTDTPGGALYLGKILGLTFNGDTVTDIIGSSGLNLYYDLAQNPGLGGLTYDLTGGGYLAPAVPLPASAWLFLSGLAGLGLLGRRRFRNGLNK